MAAAVALLQDGVAGGEEAALLLPLGGCNRAEDGDGAAAGAAGREVCGIAAKRRPGGASGIAAKRRPASPPSPLGGDWAPRTRQRSSSGAHDNRRRANGPSPKRPGSPPSSIGPRGANERACLPLTYR